MKIKIQDPSVDSYLNKSGHFVQNRKNWVVDEDCEKKHFNINFRHFSRGWTAYTKHPKIERFFLSKIFQKPFLCIQSIMKF